MRSFERALVLPNENFQNPIIKLFEIAPKAPKSPVTFIFRILHVVAISRFKTWCFSIFLFLFLSGNSVVTVSVSKTRVLKLPNNLPVQTPSTKDTSSMAMSPVNEEPLIPSKVIYNWNYSKRAHDNLWIIFKLKILEFCWHTKSTQVTPWLIDRAVWALSQGQVFVLAWNFPFILPR